MMICLKNDIQTITKYYGMVVWMVMVLWVLSFSFIGVSGFTSYGMSMKIRVGIVGLPNVGKSTLFNALAQKSMAASANFPFCTIEPNVAPIAVPDEHLQKLSTLANSVRTVPATMDWIDVAGLVKGASRGEGLGNRFLATVRECDVICHLIRYYHNPSIVHVHGQVDPVEDAEVIHLELILADLAHVERRLERLHSAKTNNNNNNKDELEQETLEIIYEQLQKGLPARSLSLTPLQKHSIKSMGLLTLKPVIYLFNVDEVDFVLDRLEIQSQAKQLLGQISNCDPSKDVFAIVSAKLEAEMNGGDPTEYLQSLGMEEEEVEPLELSHYILPLLVKQLLHLSTVYTGPGVPPNRFRTTRAHIFSSGTMTAEGLASRIHGDIQKGFIRAEVVAASTLLNHPTHTAAKESGNVRSEGRDYVLQDEETILIKWK